MATNASALSGRRAPGSERSFGLVFAGFFAIVGIFPLIHGVAPRWWLIGIGAAFALAAFLAPRSLRPLNWLWFWIGRGLQTLVNPLIMAFIYYGAVLPLGLLLRASGKDLLRLRRNPDGKSYWIKRTPSGPMTMQF